MYRGEYGEQKDAGTEQSVLPTVDNIRRAPGKYARSGQRIGPSIRLHREFAMLFKSSIVAAFATLVAMATPAHAGDTGLYIGGSAGQTTVKQDDIDFDESDTSYKAFVGYMILPFLGVEGGYVNFGGPNKSYGSLGSVDIDVDGWEAFVLGALPLGPVEVFAKVGVLSYDIDAKAQGAGFGSISGSDSDEVGAAGVGVAFAIDKFKIRGEYTYYDVSDIDDVYMLSAGVSYHF